MTYLYTRKENGCTNLLLGRQALDTTHLCDDCIQISFSATSNVGNRSVPLAGQNCPQAPCLIDGTTSFPAIGNYFSQRLDQLVQMFLRFAEKLVGRYGVEVTGGIVSCSFEAAVAVPN